MNTENKTENIQTIEMQWEKPQIITESFEETLVPKSPNSAEGATYHS